MFKLTDLLEERDEQILRLKEKLREARIETKQRYWQSHAGSFLNDF